VAKWAAGKLASYGLDILIGVAEATAGVPPGSLEASFELVLQKYLCKEASVDYGLGGGFFKFFVPVGPCGTRADGLNTQNGTTPFNCDQYTHSTYQGIDILVGDKLPVELKRSSSSVDQGQLVQYCQFAAREGLHTMVYAYVNFPMESTHKAYAKTCWKCWSGACSGTFGSIYIAFGANSKSSGKKGTHVYVPDPDLCL